MTGLRCSLWVKSLGSVIIITGAFKIFYSCFYFLGEIERTFLVLQEKGAIARQQVRDQRGTQQEVQPAAPAPEASANAEPEHRVLKRDASQDVGTPSKRR